MDVLKEAQQWVKWDPCSETREAVQAALQKKDMKELEVAFGSRIKFGTAGLRSEMGPGISRMNDLVILQTCQGLATYLIAQLGQAEAAKRGIAIGYDHRKSGTISSKSFALICANVFLSKGIKVYLFSEFVATPFVPFCVDTYGCAAGAMVTASHNPKNDNGFKVYWGNGSQIISPHDTGIAKSILENLEPWQSYEIDEKGLYGDYKDLCVDPLQEINKAYFEVSTKLCRFRDANADAKNLKITYTAMHGIGHAYTSQSFKAFNLAPYIEVKEQVLPDPEFPTVAFPNPEEGKGALQLSIATAEANGSKLILANDPDADRLAVAEQQPDGSWKIFTGNEIGALLAHWQFTQTVAAGHPKEKIAMVASTVSSKLIKAMAEVEGFKFEETLTGFKFIGNKAIDLRKQGYNVVFSYEEAIGFCIGDVVNDKDGVVAAAVFAEMANHLHRNGSSCLSHLQNTIYAKYGFFASNNYYIVSPDAAINAQIFENIRNKGRYLFCCGQGKNKYAITGVRDLLSPGYDSNQPDGVPTLPVSGSTQMITLYFENGCVATLRMSGTEPKLKYYTELSGPDLDTAQKELDQLVEHGIKGDLLQLEA